jgi:hypothetical protein
MLLGRLCFALSVMLGEDWYMALWWNLCEHAWVLMISDQSIFEKTGNFEHCHERGRDGKVTAIEVPIAGAKHPSKALVALFAATHIGSQGNQEWTIHDSIAPQLHAAAPRLVKLAIEMLCAQAHPAVPAREFSLMMRQASPWDGTANCDPVCWCAAHQARSHAWRAAKLLMLKPAVP